ncbi:hypothetical protein Tco_1371023 [Tanacetum coccineum]
MRTNTISTLGEGANTGASENVNGGFDASLLLLQELARAVDSGNIKDHLLVLFRREIVVDSHKLREFREASSELREAVKFWDIYIEELKMWDNSDDVLGSIEIMRRM